MHLRIYNARPDVQRGRPRASAHGDRLCGGGRILYGARAAGSYLADGRGTACAVRHTGNGRAGGCVASRISTGTTRFCWPITEQRRSGLPSTVAHQRMESLEHAARIVLAARALGRVRRVERRATCAALRSSARGSSMTDTNRSLQELPALLDRTPPIREVACRARCSPRDDAAARLRARASRLSRPPRARRRAVGRRIVRRVRGGAIEPAVAPFAARGRRAAAPRRARRARAARSTSASSRATRRTRRSRRSTTR